MDKLNKIMLSIISAAAPMGVILMVGNIAQPNNNECLTALAMMIVGCWAIVRKENI